MADGAGAKLETAAPDPDGGPDGDEGAKGANVYGLAEGTSCSEAAVTRPHGATTGAQFVAVDVQGRRLGGFIAACDFVGWSCFGIASGYLALFADGTDTRGLAVDLRTDGTATGGEVVTTTRGEPAPNFDPVLWRQDPTEFSEGRGMRWRDGLGFAGVPPERAIVRTPLDGGAGGIGASGAATDVLLLRRGRAATARLGPVGEAGAIGTIGTGGASLIGMVGGREGPLQVEPWSTTLEADGTRRVTTLSADGRVDEVVWESGRVLRRTLGRVAIPAGERGVGVVLDGARGLVVATTRVGEGTFVQAQTSVTATNVTWSFASVTRFYRAALPAGTAGEAGPGAPWLEVEVEGSGPDLRICAGDSGALAAGAWTLGGRAARVLVAGARCVVLVRPVSPPPATLDEAQAVQIAPDAFAGEGTVPGLGRALVAVRTNDPTNGPAALRGALDRGFAAGPSEAPRALVAGGVAETRGGAWTLGVAGLRPAACADASCVSLTWTAADGMPTSFAVAVPGNGTARLVRDPEGGVVVSRGDLGADVVHVATDGTPTTEAWPVGTSGTAVEHWVVGRAVTGGGEALWRCAVGLRDFGTADHPERVVEGVSCARAPGQGGAAVAPRCARGLACDDVASVDEGVMQACGGRLRFDPETTACGLAPTQPAPGASEGGAGEPDPASIRSVVRAPDGARFRLIEESMFGGGLGINSWRVERWGDNGALPVASGYRWLRFDVSGEPLSLVAGREALAVLAGTTVVARIVREDADGQAPVCGAARCAPNAACLAGTCVCPPGTDGACLGAPGSELAPAPSCAAVGATGPAFVDPDGLGGPFPVLAVTCADVSGLGLAAVGTPATADIVPRTLHGAFVVRGGLPLFVPGEDAFAVGLILDGPELSPSHDGLGAWESSAALAPGRLSVGLARNAVGQSSAIEVRDGRAVTVVDGGDAGGSFAGAAIEVRRDAAGTLSVWANGVMVYTRASGKLVPMRGSFNDFAWAGSACAQSGSAWPSAPAICACTPVDCAARHAACGMVDDGCGRLQDCGGCSGGTACEDNHCGCAHDASESVGSNDDTHPKDLGSGYHATFAGTFHDAADVDRFTFFSPVEITKTNPYNVVANIAGPPGAAGATFALTLEGMIPGTFCTLTCLSGAQSSGVDAPLTGGTSCSASGTKVTLQLDCVGFQVTGASLGLTVRPTAWDAGCVPYTLSLDVDAQ